MRAYCALFFLLFVTVPAYSVDAERLRLIVSTDIGGTDPDDLQSMVHLLLYADTFDIEGLISSPFGPGRKKHILNIISLYEKDYPFLSAHSNQYPTPATLREITKQGETELAPFQGYRNRTEGSQWIIKRARVKDPRPLHLLVWGGLEDLAQALHDAPDILPKLRVYYIGGPNKKWSPDAYHYIATHHPKLWLIESNATYRGWFVGGNQEGEWGNKAFVSIHIAGHCALGNYFTSLLDGTMKMGDTPSVARLLNGNPEDPSQPSWGGEYVRAWPRPYRVFKGFTTEKDTIEEFGIAEIVLPLGETGIPQAQQNVSATMHIENQALVGFVDNNNLRFRFSPKAARPFLYTIKSTDLTLNGKTGVLTAIPTNPEAASIPDKNLPHWWVDNPTTVFSEGPHIGAKTVSRWRKAYLSDFAKRLQRCQTPSVTTPPLEYLQ